MYVCDFLENYDPQLQLTNSGTVIVIRGPFLSESKFDIYFLNQTWQEIVLTDTVGGSFSSIKPSINPKFICHITDDIHLVRWRERYYFFSLKSHSVCGELPDTITNQLTDIRSNLECVWAEFPKILLMDLFSCKIFSLTIDIKQIKIE